MTITGLSEQEQRLLSRSLGEFSAVLTWLGISQKQIADEIKSAAKRGAESKSPAHVGRVRE